MSARKPRAEDRSLYEINEALSTELTQQSRKRTVFRGALIWMLPLTIHHLPKAIVHIDADAFFASCEQSRNPAWQDKPVVTGKERGIAASMSYEAKARGVTRGMRLSEVKERCPNAILLPSDYETYRLALETHVRHRTAIYSRC